MKKIETLFHKTKKSGFDLINILISAEIIRKIYKFTMFTKIISWS
jgi:hypothetical protein